MREKEHKEFTPASSAVRQDLGSLRQAVHHILLHYVWQPSSQTGTEPHLISDMTLAEKGAIAGFLVKQMKSKSRSALGANYERPARTVSKAPPAL